MRAHALEHHVQRDLIVSALGDDDIRLALRGLNELLVHGLDGGQVLIHDALKAPAAVAHVAHDPAQDAHVRIRVDVDLDIHQVTKLLALEYQQSLDDDDARGLDGYGFFGAVVDGVVVGRAMDRFAAAQLSEVLDEKLGVECVGVVVIELCALLKAHAVVSLVVVVVVDDADVAAEVLHDLARDRRFAAARAAGNADNDDAAVFHIFLPYIIRFLLFSYIIPHRVTICY